MTLPFLAVHLSDGVLTWPWLVEGFVLAAVLVGLSLYRLASEEIPRIALLTAAFFIASLIHVRAGPVSVHLLLNGLIGVALARRAPLAIAEGLLLQVLLLGHGGWTTLGVNTCVMSVPALLAGWSFPVLARLLRRPTVWRGFAFTALALFFWALAACASVEMLIGRINGHSPNRVEFWADSVSGNPRTIGLIALAAMVLAAFRRRWFTGLGFSLGLLLGVATTLLTVGLNFLILLWGGIADWQTLAILVLVAHLPIAVIEGLILGFTIPFLLKVNPSLLGMAQTDAGGGKISSNGTSH